MFCTLSFTFAQYEDNFPEGKMKEGTDSGELLSRVQELENELKDSEWKRMDLTHENMALVNHLKVCQEQKDHTEQAMADLKKRLVSTLSSQVRRVEGFGQSSRVLHKYSPWTTSLSRISLCLQQGGAVKDSALTAPSDSHSKRYFALHLCHMYKLPLSLMCGYIHTIWFIVYRCVFAVLYIYCTTLSLHIVQLSCSVGSPTAGG